MHEIEYRRWIARNRAEERMQRLKTRKKASPDSSEALRLAQAKYERADARCTRATEAKNAVELWWAKQTGGVTWPVKKGHSARIELAKCLIECGLASLVGEIGAGPAIAYLEAWAEEVPYMDSGNIGQ